MEATSGKGPGLSIGKKDCSQIVTVLFFGVFSLPGKDLVYFISCFLINSFGFCFLLYHKS